MTVQEKINLLTANLSASEIDLPQEEYEEMKRITEIASEYFIDGVISSIDLEMLLETYEKYDSILDEKLALLKKREENQIHQMI